MCILLQLIEARGVLARFSGVLCVFLVLCLRCPQRGSSPCLSSPPRMPSVGNQCLVLVLATFTWESYVCLLMGKCPLCQHSHIFEQTFVQMLCSTSSSPWNQWFGLSSNLVGKTTTILVPVGQGGTFDGSLDFMLYNICITIIFLCVQHWFSQFSVEHMWAWIPEHGHVKKRRFFFHMSLFLMCRRVRACYDTQHYTRSNRALNEH